MALTLLVESGWLGRTQASAKRGLRGLSQAVGRGMQPRRAAGYEGLHSVSVSTACIAVALPLHCRIIGDILC